ncbi:MAG: DNA-binding protein [Sphingobium sp.]|nr:MAG: DNA-binding protein [Sphingobium sp.]
MNLIPTNAAQTMSSREIAELVDKRHDNVKRTIETLAESGVIVRPQIEDEPEVDAMGRTRVTKVYVFTGEQGKRDSIVVVAQLCPEFTARLVDRWAELERAVQSHMLALPQDFASALRALADSTDKVHALEAKVEADAPKVAFAEGVVAAPDAISIGQAAKILGTGRNRLASLMRQAGWLTRTNEPYQPKINSGLLDVKIGSWEHPEKGLQRSVTTLVTGKGLAKLRTIVHPQPTH